ncbi:MAG: HigA family addiction module antitoxin, partial [Candidatus Paceibacterota bacterium]
MIKKNSKQYIEDKKRKGLYGWDDSVPVHPGQTLKNEMAFWGFTQAKMAAKVGCTVQTINRIVKGREPISPEIAIKLERAFSGRPSAKLWLGMQSEYDRVMARQKEERLAEEEVGLFENRLAKTFKELQRFGLGEGLTARTKEEKRKIVILLKDFFETSSLDSVQDKNILGVAFRKYDRKNINQYNLAALLKIGEKEAKKYLDDPELAEYDEDGFKSNLENIKRLTKLKPKEFRRKLQQECLKFGVIVVYVPNISHTFFGGATTWIGGRPVIMLKLENQHEDTFWFNFFHESAHILKHNKKEIFIY